METNLPLPQMPMPQLAPPPLDEAVAAEQALAVALAKNRDAEKVVAGMTAEQAETLLSWIVIQARSSLLTWERKASQFGTNCHSPVSLFSVPDEMAGRCPEATEAVALLCQLLGLTHFTHHADFLGQQLKMQNREGHVFATVEMPVVDAQGVAHLQSYLVDPTFQQFFARDRLEWGDSWVQLLYDTPEGKQLADTLVRDGYMALTPQRAAVHLGANMRKPADVMLGVAYDALHRDSFRPENWNMPQQAPYPVPLYTPIEFSKHHGIPCPEVAAVAANGVLLPGTVGKGVK